MGAFLRPFFMEKRYGMLEGFNPNRYAVIGEKNKREIVMLRGRGCAWRRCRFCDYHLDCDPDDSLNLELNLAQLRRVTGVHRKLEVINSGSFVELDPETLEAIKGVCRERGIREVHFECHWMYRHSVAPLRTCFGGIGVEVKVKIGVETFDTFFRESYLGKGIPVDDPAEIAAYFDECCLLQGIPGQTAASMRRDIETGLAYFQRVCVNIMQENGKPVKPDPQVIAAFVREVYPLYIGDGRVDILMENTAFGVGGVTT